MKMLSDQSLLKFFCFLFLFSATLVVAQDLYITIPLNKTTIYRDKQIYGDFLTINRTSTLQVNFDNIRKDLAFIIFQVHSHLYNITLYQNVKEEGTYVIGTNLGLYSGEKTIKSDTFFVQNLHPNHDLKLYVAVFGYFSTDPIPGGCNSEFNVPISPFMRAIHNRNYIFVDAAVAQYEDPNCYKVNTDNINLRFYMLYLPERNFDSDVYFDGIMNMMSLKNIVKNGRLIPNMTFNRLWNTRRMISAYPGTGAVYVAVANVIDDCNNIDETKYSVHVPVTSYGCDPSVEDDCELLEDSLSQFMCASLFFIGIFICYFGHRFFKIHTFLIGFLSGLIVTYIIVALIKNDLDRPATLAIASFSGLCIGASRVVYWWIYGLPVFSIILSSADVGFLISSVVLYAVPDDWSEIVYLNLDLNFWAIFILIISIVTILLLSINFIANFICCAIIGAYATILPVDYYLGSQMKYILINIERRATVSNFNRALKMQTFQWKDWFLLFLWLGMSVSGFVYQYHQNKGRPPFPPPPRSVRAVPEEPVPIAEPSRYRRSLHHENGVRSLPYYFNERTPLLSENEVPEL